MLENEGTTETRITSAKIKRTRWMAKLSWMDHKNNEDKRNEMQNAHWWQFKYIKSTGFYTPIIWKNTYYIRLEGVMWSISIITSPAAVGSGGGVTAATAVTVITVISMVVMVVVIMAVVFNAILVSCCIRYLSPSTTQTAVQLLHIRRCTSFVLTWRICHFDRWTPSSPNPMLGVSSYIP